MVVSQNTIPTLDYHPDRVEILDKLDEHLVFCRTECKQKKIASNPYESPACRSCPRKNEILSLTEEYAQLIRLYRQQRTKR